MQNWHRWLLATVLGFAGGLCQCAAANGTHAVGDYVRAGLIGVMPTIGALKMTLEKQ